MLRTVLHSEVVQRHIPHMCSKQADQHHTLQAGKIYRWKMVQASTMKWFDLSMDLPGCTWGIYSRDAVFLHSFPRMADHLMLGPANRRVGRVHSCGPSLLVLCHLCPCLAAGVLQGSLASQAMWSSCAALCLSMGCLPASAELISLGQQSCPTWLQG